MTVLAALAAEAASTAPAPAQTAAGAGKAPAAGRCTLTVPTLSSDGTQIAVHGQCVRDGRHLPSTVTYSYRSSDYYGYPCGSTLAGVGSTIPLRYPKASFVLAQFTITATDGTLRRTRQLSVPTGSHAMDCQRRSSFDPIPDPRGIVCYYGTVFSPPTDPNATICGEPFDGSGKAITQPSELGAMPVITSIPQVYKNRIEAPSFATLSGICQEQDQNDNVIAWLGNQVHPTAWVCSDGTYLVPEWWIYLAPDGKSGQSTAPYPSCKAGDFRVPPTSTMASLPFGGTFTHFTIPANWEGRIDVEFELKVFSGKGDSATGIGYELSDYSFYPGGTVNGCPALLAASRH